MLGRKGRLEQHQLFELYTFAHGRDVVDDGRGKLFRLKPKARKSVPLGKHQDGIKTRLLNGGAEEQRKIKTRRQTMFRDVARAAHLLAGLLKARRW
ncbi:hypothetical protein D3C76_1239950 [compost metagenome]